MSNSSRSVAAIAAVAIALTVSVFAQPPTESKPSASQADPVATLAGEGSRDEEQEGKQAEGTAAPQSPSEAKPGREAGDRVDTDDQRSGLTEAPAWTGEALEGTDGDGAALAPPAAAAASDSPDAVLAKTDSTPTAMATARCTS